MPSLVKWNVKDYSNESSIVQFTLAQGTAANFDALIAQKNAISAALADIMLGVLETEYFIAQKNNPANGPAGTPIAQREMKWRLIFTDDVTGGTFDREVPCADISNAALFAGNTDIANLAATEWVAFKAAVDGIVRNNATGNTATLTSAILEGRNL